MKLSADVVYTLVARPLAVVVTELREWGIPETTIRSEIERAIKQGLQQASGNETRANAGH